MGRRSKHSDEFWQDAVALYRASDRSSARQSLTESPARQEKAAAEADLVAAIRDEHTTSGGTYGVPRVDACLRDKGRRVSHKRSPG